MKRRLGDGTPAWVGSLAPSTMRAWSRDIQGSSTLMDEARALAERLLLSAPIASRVVKEVATRTATMGWTEAVRFGETMRIVANQTDDAKEGVRSFAEKRAPEWKGH